MGLTFNDLPLVSIGSNKDNTAKINDDPTYNDKVA